MAPSQYTGQNSYEGERRPRDEAAPDTKLFVGNISWGCSDKELAETFGQHGNVLNAVVLKDRETGRSRGFGFVTMSSPEEASVAVTAMDGQTLDGRQLRVNLANSRS
ncbi:hypothetical protein SeMB42_g05794 [Synchytrium endobioticum]|nr:hypothetical protein SeMB42_g05794 [Synchytrium endobioticum]